MTHLTPEQLQSIRKDTAMRRRHMQSAPELSTVNKLEWLLEYIDALTELVRELTEGKWSGIARDDWGGYCLYCHKHVTHPHDPTCPIVRGREMTKEAADADAG